MALLTMVALVLGAIVLILAGATVIFYFRWQKAEAKRLDAEIEQATVTKLDEGELVDLPPPQVKTGGLYAFAKELWHYKKQQKQLLGKGYVKWLLLEDGWPTPKFVKPVVTGGGIPQIVYGKEAYLFPQSATVPDVRTGLRTIVHRKGEADPVNLPEPNRLAIGAAELYEYLNKELITKAPKSWKRSFGLDLTPQQIMMLGVAGFLILMAIGSYLGVSP